MIEIAHNCAVLGIPFDSARLLADPPGDYMLALSMVIERVSATNRAENARVEAQYK